MIWLHSLNKDKFWILKESVVSNTKYEVKQNYPFWKHIDKLLNPHKRVHDGFVSTSSLREVNILKKATDLKTEVELVDFLIFILYSLGNPCFSYFFPFWIGWRRLVYHVCGYSFQMVWSRIINEWYTCSFKTLSNYNLIN